MHYFFSFFVVIIATLHCLSPTLIFCFNHHANIPHIFIKLDHITKAARLNQRHLQTAMVRHLQLRNRMHTNVLPMSVYQIPTSLSSSKQFSKQLPFTQPSNQHVFIQQTPQQHKSIHDKPAQSTPTQHEPTQHFFTQPHISPQLLNQPPSIPQTVLPQTSAQPDRTPPTNQCYTSENQQALIQQHIHQSVPYLKNCADIYTKEITQGECTKQESIRYNNRLHAINESENNNYSCAIMSYNLSQHANQSLQESFVNTDIFILCNGTSIQHCIQQEIVTILNQAAVIPYTPIPYSPNKSSPIRSTIWPQLPLNIIKLDL